MRGVASEIESLDELIRVEELGLEPWADGDKRRYIRIQPHVVTGRRVPDPAE